MNRIVTLCALCLVLCLMIYCSPFDGEQSSILNGTTVTLDASLVIEHFYTTSTIAASERKMPCIAEIGGTITKIGEVDDYFVVRYFRLSAMTDKACSGDDPFFVSQHDFRQLLDKQQPKPPARSPHQDNLDGPRRPGKQIAQA